MSSKIRTAIVAGMLLLVAFPSYAQIAEPSSSVHKANIDSISPEQKTTWNGIEQTTQVVTLQLLDGPEMGTAIEVTSVVNAGPDTLRLQEGKTILVDRIVRSTGEVTYTLREPYRITALLVLLGIFVLLAVILGGKTGVLSFIGLAISIAILIGFVVPQIAAGKSPLLISLIGSCAIACSSIYLAHGLSRRTTTALISTMITLALTTLFAVVAVHITQLFGTGSEEAVFLQYGLQSINLQGLLLGGIVIGALGVLDDITTAQTAAIAEISRANPRLGYRELFTRGQAVGREHIASLINTLALAYFGTSMPLMLLFSLNRELPLWTILNTAFIAEEIVRTVVGSSALLLAVPISTWLAARTFAHGRHRTESRSGGHSHAH